MYTLQQIGDKLYLRYRRFAHDKARTMHQNHLQQRLLEAQRSAGTSAATATATAATSATPAAASASGDAIRSANAPHTDTVAVAVPSKVINSGSSAVITSSADSKADSNTVKVKQLHNTTTAGDTVHTSATVAAANVKVSS
jgi:hypothetical protein